MIILLGFLCFLVSLDLFLDIKSHKYYNVILISITTFIFGYFTLIDNSFKMRIIVFSSTMVIMAFQASIILLRKIIHDRHTYYSITFISFFMYIIIYSIRILNAFTGRIGLSYLTASPYENLFILLSMITGILMMMGLGYMINGRLIHNLNHQARDRENLLYKTKAIAELDGLTGLFNRMKIEEILVNEINNRQEDICSLSVLLIDIDDFKTINDTLGHNVGDKVLKKFSNLLQENVRSTDYPGRWGGDEFIVILPNVTIDNAMVIAEKIRMAVLNETIVDDIKFTVSIGLATFSGDNTSEEFITSVDKALYQSKKEGKNRVTRYLETK